MTTATPTEAKVDPKRSALGAATSTVLLADSGKYDSFAKYRVVTLDELDAIITDDGLTAHDAKRLDAMGVDLTRVTTAATG